MTPNQRLDNISERLKRQQSDPPPPGVKVDIDYAEVGRRLDEIYMARAEKIIAQGNVVILTDAEIEAWKPEDAHDGLMDYDQYGRWADAFFIAKVFANKQTQIAGEDRQENPDDFRK